MKKKITEITNKAMQMRFVKFFISGGLAFVVDAFVLNVVSFIFFKGNNYSILNIISVPKIISSIFGLVVIFLLNRQWVFKDNEGSYRKQLPRFIALSIFNIFLSSFLFNIYHNVFAAFIPNVDDNLIKAIINVISSFAAELTKMFLTYFMYKHFIFGTNKKAAIK